MSNPSNCAAFAQDDTALSKATDDGKTHITFFRDASAARFTTERLTMIELRERIINASAREKKYLPWLKLAFFGNQRSLKGSYRIDSNVSAISGIEIDCDGEKISFLDALTAFKAMNIQGLIYTSPSHSTETPRYRIIAPTSKPLPPAMRKKLAKWFDKRMKASLGVTEFAANESFNLSQAYYYGYVMNKPGLDHRAEVTEGDFIDQHTGFDEAHSEPVPDRAQVHVPDKFVRHSVSARGHRAILSKIGDGDGLEGFNGPLTRAAASYVAERQAGPLDKDRLKSELRSAIKGAPKKSTRNPADIDRYLSDEYLDQAISSAERKFHEKGSISPNDFVSSMANGMYLFIPTREYWPAKSVNAAIPPIEVSGADAEHDQPLRIRASQWLDRHRRVEQIVWAPGAPEIIKDKLLVDGGWIERREASVFNLYRPPTLALDDLTCTTADEVGPWLGHIKTIYPDDWEHLVMYLAHRVQRPAEKINHALMLGGSQGIGKDTILEPVKHAVGPWNWQEVSPAQMLGRFNGHLRSIVLRISEARDLGDINRFSFYEHLKTVTAAPPDTHRVDEKNLREHYIVNVCGVILTTNYKTGGVYLPPDDRRTYVAWSTVEKDAFSEAYWRELWHWLHCDGIRKVAAFLTAYDLTRFNPKAPPKRTPAFYEIVAAGVAPEEIGLADLIDRMGNPDTLTISQLIEKATAQTDLSDIAEWLNDRGSRKAVPHKLEQCGYVRVANPDNKQGVWPIKMPRLIAAGAKIEIVSQRQQVYAKNTLCYADQLRAVRMMIDLVSSDVDDVAARDSAWRAFGHSRWG